MATFALSHSSPIAGGKLARIGITLARIALGLVFTLAGASIFFLIANPPPLQPGLAGAFQQAFFQSHWVVFVDLVELAAGVLLLANRFVPLALVLLGAVLSNILAFHITMQPSTIGLPTILTGLWFALAYHHRAQLAPLFTKGR
jgi:putative oxidoreductase